MSPSSYTCRQSLILSGGELLAIPPGTGQITQLYFRVDCEQSQFMPTPSSVMTCVESIVTSNCTHMMDIGLRCVLEPSAGGGIDGIIPPAHCSVATIPLQSLTKLHLLSLLRCHSWYRCWCSCCCYYPSIAVCDNSCRYHLLCHEEKDEITLHRGKV